MRGWKVIKMRTKRRMEGNRWGSVRKVSCAGWTGETHGEYGSLSVSENAVDKTKDWKRRIQPGRPKARENGIRKRMDRGKIRRRREMDTHPFYWAHRGQAQSLLCDPILGKGAARSWSSLHWIPMEMLLSAYTHWLTHTPALRRGTNTQSNLG